MRDALVLSVPVLVLGILICCWRALYLVFSRRPAAAVVWRTDDSATERHALRPLGDGKNGRVVDEVVHFEDSVGNRHVAQVRRRIWGSRRPLGVHLIWYDPKQPERATAVGPSRWLLKGMALLATLTAVLHLGLHQQI